jgi:hypothetical protein
VLMVDGDLGVMYALANQLDGRRISLIPAASIKQAGSQLTKPEPNIDILIIICRVIGVCALAEQMVRRHAALGVIGIVSNSHQCASCRKLLTFCAHGPEPRDFRWTHKMVILISSRLSKKQRTAENGFSNT